MARSGLAVMALLLLTSCNGSPEEQAGIENAAIAMNASDPGVSGRTLPPSDDETPAAGSLAEIPAAFHGRWGLAAADCGPDAGAAKGLLTITGDMLRFYESVGKPARLSRTRPDQVEGRFAFSGEGMDWSKDLTLSLEEGQLVRREHDPAASYTYSRCPA